MAADNGVLLPPSNLAYQVISPDDGKLTWSSVYAATGYNVYQITEGQLVFVGTTKTNSYSLNNQAEGQYSYIVSTLSTDGESGPCAPVDVNIVYPTMAAPSTLTSSIQNGNDIVLNWGTAQYADKYNVYQISADGSKKLLTSTTSRTYTIQNASEGNYAFSVSAENNLYGESAASTPVDVNLVYPVMKEPTNLTFTITNGNDVNLKWQAASYANSYLIYKVVDGQEIYATAVTTTNAVFANVPASDYEYKIYSKSDRFGTSENGASVSLTVSPVTMSPPSTISYKLQNVNDVVLNWSASSYATGYKVYQINDGQRILKGTYTGTTVTYPNQSGGDYVYEVHSFSDRFGESELGTQVKLTVSTVTMNPPDNAAYKVQNLNDIVLTWNSAAYAESYKIYQIVDGQRVLKSTVTGTTASFTNMPAGNYKYEITSYNSRFGESETSSDVSLTLDPVIMEKPPGISYKIQNGNDILLSWDASPNTTNYKVYQVVNGQRILKSTVTGNSVTYTNMPEGDYSYEVHSYNSRFGESAEGAALSFSLLYPSMESPGNPEASITSPTAFTLNWDPSPYATSYKVYQVVNGTKNLKNTVTGTSINYSNVQQGDYVYEIHSYSSRFGESKDGSLVTVKMTGQAMGTPTNLQYTILNGNDIKLTWGPVQYSTNYKVYKMIDGFKLLQSTVTGTSVTYTNQAEGDYDFVVDSYYSLLGESPEGAEVQFNLTYPIMVKPANLTGTILNISDINLKWNSVQYASSYKIYEIIDGVDVLKGTIAGTSFQFSKVTEGTHAYEVHSVSSRFGDSLEGSVAESTITFPKMLPPTNLTNTIVNGNDVVLKWDAAPYATGYNIYQIIDGEKQFVKTVSGTTVTFSNMAEGDYTYEVYTISDRFGESEEGSLFTLTVDFPEMKPPANLTKSILNGNDIKLSWNASLYASAYNIYRVEDGNKTFIKTTTATNLTFVNMPEGDYQYEVHSYSPRFGESKDGSILDFSLVFPIMQSPTVFSYSILNGNDIKLSWNSSAYATAYKVYQIINGEKVLQRTVTGTTVTFSNMPEGDYQYEIDSYSDRFGESPVGNTISFSLNWPIVQPPVLQGTIFNANNVTLSWNSVSWANEYRVYEINEDNKVLIYHGTALSYKIYNLTEETHTYQVTAYSSRFGESVLSNPAVENIIYPEMQPPVAAVKVTGPVSAVISWNFVTYANGYNIYEMVDGTPVLLVKNVNNLSYTFSNLSYKNHIYYVTSYSNSFGESQPSDSVWAKLITDTTPPVTTANGRTDWTTSSQTITLTSTDDETGVDKTYYSINGSDYKEGTSFTVEHEGVNFVSFYSVDKTGNKEEAKTIEVKIDKTVPKTSIDAPETWLSSDVTVHLTAIDRESGVSKTYYSIKGLDYVEGTSFTVDQEGVYQVAYYSVDQAGNKEEIQTTEVKIDKTAPETSSDAPNSWVNSDVTVNLTPNDSESRVSKTYYSINGSDYVEGTSFTVDQAGVNKVAYYSVDQAGNEEAKQTAEVKIDNTAPETSSDAPETWVNSDVTVNLTPNDSESGVSKTYYSINGSDYVEGTTFTVNPEGVNQVSYYSIDQAGNKETVQTVEVKIDKTLPVITTNFNDLYELGSQLSLDYNTSDLLSGVVKETVILSSPNDPIGTVVNKFNQIQLDQPGVYSLTILAADAAENTQTVNTKFTVYIPASIEVTPNVIKGNKGVFTVRVQLPKSFAVNQLDLNSAKINGIAALNSNNGYYNQAKQGQFKFERSNFTWTTGEKELEFRCNLNGYLVIGKKVVKVID
ncbi:OmpL47-type beta-barrel domain-containing protein [Neobacillus terrae]|uniref:OmpL47-type beta-barrel domain-containing protein n=1 Tax=Neobacillus terrae TaxID=3034837 RepID=UPI001FB07855|nr:hypothetical protein [Neobacillus terrae]